MTDHPGAGVTRCSATRLGLIEALRQVPGMQGDTVAMADRLLEHLTPPASVPADLRARIDAALDESTGRCARCKVCDAQADAVLAVVGPHLERLAELERAVTWGTSCLSCSAVLDSCIRETVRAERAEEELAALLANVEPVMELLEDAWAFIASWVPLNPSGRADVAEAWRQRYESVVRAHAAAPAREAAGEPGRTLTEWCVWYGGEDPNDCAGLLTYDDEEDAAGHAQWFKGGRVASRTVTRGPWQAAAEVHEICPARHPEHATPCTWLAGHGTVHRDADDAIWSDSAGRVTVAKSDLSSILAAAWGMTGDAEAFNRLAEAAGLVHP